jgi:lysophospholipase L1-like esterase
MSGRVRRFARNTTTKMKHQGFASALSTTTPTTRPIRIFCFGDSLTAGTSPPDFANFPYAPHLEAALRPNIPSSVVVRHAGFPGWTSSQLLEDANDEQGLRTMVRKIKDPSLSMVILLAGTNDLGYQQPGNDIVQSVVALHQLCYEEDIPHTLAIGIPPSGYQSFNKEAAEASYQVNQGLQAFCETEPKATFFPFPFAWAKDDDRWASDGLHFSARGYQELGESLAPMVERILSSNVE